MLRRPARLCRKRGVGAARRFLSPRRVAPVGRAGLPGRGARLPRRRLLRPRDRDASLPVPAASLSADGRNGGGLLRGRRTAARHAGG